MGLLLFHIVHEGSVEVRFKDWPGFSTMEIVGVLFNFIQPIVVALDPSLNVRASDETHEVGTLLIGVSGNGRVAVHDHKPFKYGEEVEGLASITAEVL